MTEFSFLFLIHLSLCFSQNPTASIQRCGLDFTDAYINCKTTCTINADCPPNERCFVGLTERPCLNVPTPVVLEPVPVVSEPVPVVSEPVPVVSEPVPVVSEPTPVVSEPTPVVSEPVPVVSEPVPVVSEPTPVVSEPTPVVSEPVPVVSEPTPVVSEPVGPVTVPQEPVPVVLQPVGPVTVGPVTTPQEPVPVVLQPVGPVTVPITPVPTEPVSVAVPSGPVLMVPLPEPLIGQMPPPENVGAYIGAGVGGFLGLLVLFGGLVLSIKCRDLSFNAPPPIPNDLRWSFHEAYTEGRPSSTGLYLKKLNPQSSSWKTVLNLFSGPLAGGNLSVTEIYSVYAPGLLEAFSIYRENMEKRLKDDKGLFASQSWKNDGSVELRQCVLDAFNQKVRSYPWNEGETVPILPVVHGTGFEIALKICETGFVILSSLDEGWYGNGIYFSSNVLYAAPYYAPKPDPAVVIAYVIPGTPYPVIEHPKDPGSLLGTPLKKGYQCHYVRTTISGFPVQLAGQPGFDELVVAQEAQVVPAFIIRMDPSSAEEVLKIFNRETVQKKGLEKVKKKETVSVVTENDVDEVYQLWDEKNE